MKRNMGPLTTEQQFRSLMRRLLAEYPDFKSLPRGENGEPGTTDVWWDACKVIPYKYLAAGIDACITSKKFYPHPHLHDVLEASVGNLHAIIPHERMPFSEVGLTHILGELKYQYEETKKLPPPDTKQIEGPAKPRRKISEVVYENELLTAENQRLLQEIAQLKTSIRKLEERPKTGIRERKALLQQQAKEIGVSRKDVVNARQNLLEEQRRLERGNVE